MYPALELGQPGNEACPDQPNIAGEANALWCPGSKRLILQVSTNAVFIQLGYMEQGRGAGLGSVAWQTPKPFLPCMAALTRDFDAIRVWNYTKGQAAQVFVTADRQ